MICPACGADTADDARYCRSCGGSLADTAAGAETPREADDLAPEPDELTPGPQTHLPAGEPFGDRVHLPVVAIVAVVAVVIIGLVAFLLLRGGDGNDRFPEAVRQNFMTSCTQQGAAESTCTCMLEALEERMTIEEFERLESEIQTSESLPEAFIDAIGSCAQA